MIVLDNTIPKQVASMV